MSQALSQIKQKIDETLKLPERDYAGFFLSIVSRLDPTQWGERRQMMKLIDHVSKMDSQIFSLAEDTANVASTEAGKAKNLSGARSAVSGLIQAIGNGAEKQVDKFCDARDEVLKVLNLPTGFDSLSTSEKLGELKKCYAGLSKADKKLLEDLKTDLRYSLGGVRVAVDGILKVQEKVKSFEQRLTKSILSSSASASEKRAALFSAVSKYETLVQGITSRIAAPGAVVTTASMLNALERGSQKIAGEIEKDLANKKAATDASALKGKLDALLSELKGTAPSAATLPDGRKVVGIPNAVLGAINSRLTRAVAADYTKLNAELATYNDTTKTDAERAAAAGALATMLPALQESYNSFARTYNSVCELFAKATDHQVKVTDASGAAVLASKKAEVITSKYRNELIDGLWAKDMSLDPLVMDAEITTKCTAIQSELQAGFEAKLVSVINDASNKIADLGQKCEEAVAKAVGLLDQSTLKGRFKLDDDAFTYDNAMDEFEALAKDIKKELA